MNDTYKFSRDSTLTRTEIEQKIRDINKILKLYDSLIKFLWEYENDSIHIYNAKKELTKNSFNIIPGMMNFEDVLQKIKFKLEII